MPLKVNEFIIQAKVIEDANLDSSEDEKDETIIPDSVKKEIIDECISKVEELIQKEKTRH